jgi:phytoene dehydrogenase-like protein
VNLALDGLPAFAGVDDPAERLGGHLVVSPSLEYLERAADDAKYGRVSERPALDVVLPALLDPGLAPAGQHLLSVSAQWVPYALAEGGWDEAARQALGDRVVGLLGEIAPDLPGRVCHRQVITPLDWEAEYGLTGGHPFQGEMGLDQLLFMRPVPGWGQYRMPVAGLYLCGAGAHPGGGVTGAPGYNAAREALRELRRRRKGRDGKEAVT